MGRRAGSQILAAVLLAGLVGCSTTPVPSPTPRVTPAASADARSQPPATVPPEIASRLSTTLTTSLAALGAPGAQAAIVFDDGSVWAGAAGLSTEEAPMTSDLLMPYASVTKVYTAAIVLQLAADAVVPLDAEASHWLPDAPNLEGVTIRQLLTHTSGIASDDPTLPPVCQAGACYSYSNGGYQLLGQVIEAATGGTYAATLRRKILAPQDLRATFYPREEDAPGDQAVGHLRDETQPAMRAATSGEGPGWIGASGGLVGTAEDLARFGNAVFAGDVLDAGARATMTDVDATRGLPGTSDCRAEAIIGRRGMPFGDTWSHGGNAGWFRAWLEHYPAHGLTVAVLVNSDAFPGSIADAIVETALEGVPTTVRGGHCEDAIAVRSADGAVRRHPDLAGFDGIPAWSPDGESLAWLTFRDNRTDLVIARADGTHPRSPLTDERPVGRVAWSPDGRRLAFTSNRDGDAELYLLRLADGGITRLTDNDVDDWVPAWSPDGRSIAFIRTDGENELRVMRSDGTSDRPVDGAHPGAWWPAWAPEGDRIAYESGGAIWIVPVAGGDPDRLAVERLRVVRLPTWAPSADLAFSSDGDLYAAAPDGSNVRRLTETSTEEAAPAWAPDGESLAFQVSFWVDGVD